MPTFDFFNARLKGLFRYASSYSTVGDGLFLVRARKTFYCRAMRFEIEDLGIPETLAWDD